MTQYEITTRWMQTMLSRFAEDAAKHYKQYKDARLAEDRLRGMIQLRKEIQRAVESALYKD